ncbi:MAG: iron ABC transporter permease [Methanomassiliicoccaceae archaeon]|nr:iron ABC transporter permease [Methanomassiliicoccaceae archaeon]
MFDSSDEFAGTYKSHFRRSTMMILLLIFLIIITVIISISISQYPISLAEAYQIMIDHLKGVEPTSYAERLKDHIVWEMNMPRAMGGIAVGAVLGVGGVVMQSIIKNPLADPYTTGISSGALFGVTLYVIFGFSVIPFSGGELAQMANAFLFALIPAGVIIFISSFKKMSPTMMVLIGIGVMYLFTASTTLLKFTANPDNLVEIYTWGVGSIGKITWDNIPLLVGAMAFIIFATLILSKSINVLTAGDNAATSLGVNPVRFRMLCLVIVSVTTAAAVCFTGTIGFVGLVAPHIGRIFVGSNSKYLIPCAACIGAFMLIAADCIARNAGTTGLPVGVITALVGSPLFLYFLIRQKKSAW